MGLSIERYLDPGRSYKVLDFGSGISRQQTLTHRSLLGDYDCEYTGVDIRAGDNIDVVMTKPYRLPLKSRSFDVVLSGQVFEHVPFFWASLLEIARVMKPRAYFFMTVPSRGHEHSTYDCWRVYPDGLRAMAAWCGRGSPTSHRPPAGASTTSRRSTTRTTTGVTPWACSRSRRATHRCERPS